MGWCHILLVFSAEVDTFLDQELNHVIFVLLNGVEDWSFVLRVWLVHQGSIVDEELSHLG